MLTCALPMWAVHVAASAGANPAASPITDCTHVYGAGTIGAAVAAGGSWTFSCGSTAQAYVITFGSGDGELQVTKPVTIDSGPYAVVLAAQNRPGRIFNVAAGSLTLQTGSGSLNLSGGSVAGTAGAPGGRGTDGGAGTNGTPTTPDGGVGGSGGPATPAPALGASGTAKGGCMYIAAGASVTLTGIDVSNCSATGGRGGNGADGGRGGDGGAGQNADTPTETPGLGGAGGKGADGAAGANGGDGLGGAIYDAGTLAVSGGSFTHDSAIGGGGGDGGAGGAGGNGGNGGFAANASQHSGAGGAAGAGGNGGSAGSGGAAAGGAIDNAGELSVSGTTFGSDTVRGGNAGASGNLTANGGFGGHGGAGGHNLAYNQSCPGGPAVPDGSPGTGGDGGSGGNGGNGADASGAAIYSGGNPATLGAGIQFGSGATAGTALAGRADPNGPGTAGGGGAGGDGQAQLLCDGSSHPNPSGPAGAPGTAGAAGHDGVATLGDVGLVSVGNVTVKAPPQGQTSTANFPVTLSLPASAPVTVSYATADGTAHAGTDYRATSGTLTFPPGTTTLTVPVTILDAATPGRTQFTLNLSNPSGAVIGAGQGTGSILGPGPFKVTVEWQQNGQPLVLRDPGQLPQPDTLRLADADTGEIPQDLTAAVTITNTSRRTQTNVSLSGVPPLSFHDPAKAQPSLPIAVTQSPSTSALPDLAPGASTKVSYTLHVTNNGVFDFSPQVLSADPGTSQTAVSSGTGTLNVLPTAVLWLSLRRAGSGLVRAGTQVQLFGHLTNRSMTQSVDVLPIEPASASGNVGGGAVLDEIAPNVRPDGVVLPFAGKLTPGQDLLVNVRLDTSPVPGTRASVTYQPQGKLVADDGSETALSARQVGLSSGTSPVAIGIDQRDPALPPATWASTTQEFTDGVVEGSAAWAAGWARGVAEFLRHPVTGTVDGVKGIAGLVVRSPRDLADGVHMLAMEELYAATWLLGQQDFHRQLEQEIIADYQASHIKGDLAGISKQVEIGFDDFAQAAYKGDYNRVANLAGHGLATGAGAIADAVLTDIFFQKLALGLKAAGGAGRSFVRGKLADQLILADKIRDAKIAKVFFQNTKGIVSGQNLLANSANALIHAWGLLPDQIAAIQRYCRENKIIVAVRTRAKKAADLIKRGLAVGKNEVLKIKGVNEIDVEYLGYAQADENLLVLAEPPPLQEVLRRLREKGTFHDPLIRNTVLERYDLRAAEWESAQVRGKMEHADHAGEIDWGFNGSDNGAPGADVTDKRRFHLHQVRGARMLDGRTARIYKRVYVGSGRNLTGRLVRVTQDVDLGALLSANGELLSPELRAKAYQYFSDVLGIEHPETPTWIKDGEILFKAKVKELSRVAPGGGEVLAVFGPDGSARAGLINPALTIFNATTKGGTIIFEGGYNNVFAAATTALRVGIKRFF